MVELLVSLFVRFRVALLESAGAVAVVYGAALWSTAAGFVVAGVLLLAKSMEIDIRSDGGP